MNVQLEREARKNAIKEEKLEKVETHIVYVPMVTDKQEYQYKANMLIQEYRSDLR